jgi:hypothetical protein
LWQTFNLVILSVTQSMVFPFSTIRLIYVKCTFDFSSSIKLFNVLPMSLGERLS